MPTVTRSNIIQVATGVAAAAALLALPMLGGTSATAETVSPLQEFEADFVEIAINADGGESVTVNFVMDVGGLERGILEMDPDINEGRFLATIESDFQGLERLDDTRLEWVCESTDCTIAAALRIDVFTDTEGVMRLRAAGGVSSGEVPTDALLEIRAGDAVPGLAQIYELSYSLIDYPDNGDQAPHAGLDLVEYDLGDPSDEIQLVIRPILGDITLDQPTRLEAPSWAVNLVPIEFSGACTPDCSGSALVRVGPSDFSNLEYQVLAFSDRPGAARSLRATRTPLAATTEIGFVTLTGDAPVVAIPITLSGDVESTRVVADVGVRGRSSFVTLRKVGDAAFEPTVNWVAPQAGETQYELAISAPETQLGDVTTSWTVSLFTFPGAAATIEVGEPGPAQFTAGELGDPGQFLDLTLPAEDDGSGPPWGLILGGAAVAAGGAGAYRFRSKRSG